MARILFAEDDLFLCQSVVSGLTALGYSVEVANDGADAEEFAKAQSFDLLILDWNLPGRSGVDICRTYRKLGKQEPVLFLTSRDQVEDKVTALGSGADDYLTKPFDIRELLARVKSLLRRPSTYFTDVVLLGEVTLDLEGHVLKRGNESVRLQNRELELLEYFVRRPGQVLSADAILSGVWGSDFDGSEIALRSCLAKLRKALRTFAYDDVIETVHGYGYRLNLPNSKVST